MSSLDYNRHTQSESARFLQLLSNLDLTTTVPSCPDWSAADLLWHLTEVQHFWATIVGDQLAGPQDYTRPVRPDSDDGLISFFETTSTRMIEALHSVDDETPVWTWFEARQNIGFVRRRQAHEALIHRVDAELTAADLSPLDPSLATDGILEALECMFGGAPSWAHVTREGPIGRLSTNDTGTSWLVQVAAFSGEDSKGMSHSDKPIIELIDDGEPTFELSGSAADLNCWIWNRPITEPLTVTGDSTGFEAVVRSGVQ